MVNYKVSLNPATRTSLGEVRSNFLELAFERFLYTKDRLQEEKSAPVRLLLLKEVFSIFDEIKSIQDVTLNFANPQMFEPIFDLVTFVRNVLLHFPLFDSWDQIFISPMISSEMMPNRKGGQIATYLNKNLGKNDIPFEVEFSGGKASSSINLSAIKPDPELTYLKDIISENHVITLIVEIIQHLYTANQTSNN